VDVGLAAIRWDKYGVHKRARKSRLAHDLELWHGVAVRTEGLANLARLFDRFIL
jgi:hypothetical protein